MPLDLYSPDDYILPGYMNYGAGYNGEWDIEQQEANSAKAEAVVTTVVETGCGFVSNTCDAGITGVHAVNGEAGWLELGATALPFVPGVIGRFGDDVVGFVGKYVDEAVDFVNGLCSFSAETVVMTEDGLVPISEVEPDTLVLAYNEETGEIGYYPVTAVWAHVDSVIVTLTIDGEQIETTPEHPFYTIDGEWLTAAELQIGDEIRTAEWQTGTVESIDFTVAPQSMYNFTVATAHTYFVGEGQWLVHNTCITNVLDNMLHNNGNWFTDIVETQFGRFDVGGAAHVNGTQLHISDAAFFDADNAIGDIGVQNMTALLTELGTAARGYGFDTLRISGDRIFSSTSANPGHSFDVMLDLTKSRFNP